MPLPLLLDTTTMKEKQEKGRYVRRSLSGKGKRRSARLLKLEEQKNDDNDCGPAACILDPWLIIRNSFSIALRGKRKRNGEIQKLQGEASCSQEIDVPYTDNISGKGSTSGQIIDYILDMLEMRDTRELFAMPDDIQVGDYAERVERPSDFATLRQKNTDGMYKTLQQFENDVCMVFQKAMSINSHDTVPYKEAMTLLDQAKQVFLSLKNNRMYSEPDLLAWRQNQLGVKPARDQEDGGGSGDPAAIPAQQRPSITPVKKKTAGASEKKQQIIPGKKAAIVSVDNDKPRQQRGAREVKSTPSTVKRAKKGFAAAASAAAATTEAAELVGAREMKRRLTYNGGAGRDRVTMAAAMLPPPAFRDQQTTLLYHPQVEGHTYQDSLRRFVRDAGLKARLATEFKILECDTRSRQNPSPASYWNGFGPNASSYYPPSPSTALRTRSPSSWSVERPFPDCKQEADGLLRLVMLMGTPAFLETAKQVLGDNSAEESSKGTTAADYAKVTVTEAAAAPTQTSAAGNPASAPTQPSGAGNPSASDHKFSPFAPPKLALSRLGFGQFAGSSSQPFMVKPRPS